VKAVSHSSSATRPIPGHAGAAIAAPVLQGAARAIQDLRGDFLVYGTVGRDVVPGCGAPSRQALLGFSDSIREGNHRAALRVQASARSFGARIMRISTIGFLHKNGASDEIPGWKKTSR
jgi:hypothetical protein